MNNFKNIAAITLMIIFWGYAYVGIRIALTGYSPGALALFRYLIASLCMLIIYLRQPVLIRFPNIKLKDYVIIAITGILGFSIYNVALNYGEKSITAGVASFITSQIPVVITILAFMFLHERLNWQGWLGTVVSFFGILIISLAHIHNLSFDKGFLVILFATLSASIYTILQKNLLKKVHPIIFTALAIRFGTLAMTIYLPQLIQQIPKAPLNASLAAIAIGIFPGALAYLLWSYVVMHLPATKAANFLYSVPLVTTLFGWLLLQEIPNTLSLIGSVIALLGSALVNRNVIRTTDLQS